jgi:hypothetical protein
MTIALLLRNTLHAAKLHAAGTPSAENLRRLRVRRAASPWRARSPLAILLGSAGTAQHARRAHRRAREAGIPLASGWFATPGCWRAIVAALAMTFGGRDGQRAAGDPGHRRGLHDGFGILATPGDSSCA